jgi:general secretion pathway protein G
MVLRPRNNTASRVAARSGFTLLEVLIVVAILVVLAGVSSIYVFRYLDEAKSDTARASAASIATAIQAYEIKFGMPDSLQALVTPPDGSKPFISPEGLNDPWGRPFQFDAAGPHHNGLKPDVWTTHPETGQQIGNWK